MEYRTRAYADSDAAALAELFNAVDRSLGIAAHFTDAEARSVMATLVRDHPAQTRMLLAADGSLIANATVPIPPAGADTVRIFGAVHPDVQGRGIGRELLAWQLERIGTFRREREPAGSWQVVTRCDMRDTASTRLYERFAFAPTRYYAAMQAELPGGPARELPDRLRAARYRPEDLPAFHAAHMETFADHWGFVWRERAEWAALAVESGLFRPDLSRIAYDGDEIAGYVLAYDTLDPDVVFVRSVGTRRPWRGRGLATALLSHVMHAAAEHGKRSATLDVDAANASGALGVYERLGFVVTAREVAYGRAC